MVTTGAATRRKSKLPRQAFTYRAWRRNLARADGVLRDWRKRQRVRDDNRGGSERVLER